jgi:NAD(P)-dependent dehydrogenase (short-subunit alcohol dehydrogenase family)
MPMNSSSTRRTVALAAGLAALTVARRHTGTPGFDTSDLTGRTAVVTGAGSGIGRSIARLLGHRGAFVHVTDLDGASAEAVAEQIRAAGGQAAAHSLDVADSRAVDRLADDVFAAGPVDLLFNNAGIGHAGDIADTTLEDWNRLIAVNLMGVVHGLNAFLPRLLAQDRPAYIVNTASMAGLVPNPGMAPYSATKAAVVGLSEALHGELAGSNVGICVLCPGVINTGIVRTSISRGDWVQRHDAVVELYAKRGTSPDVVARQALDAVSRARLVVPTPRYQVVPGWMLKRIFPRAGRAVTAATMKQLAKGAKP